MLDPFFSIITGLVVGGIYSLLFLSSFNTRSDNSTGLDFWRGLTFIARFIFIIVAALVLTLYFKVNIFWFLISLGVAFWGCILVKLRIK